MNNSKLKAFDRLKTSFTNENSISTNWTLEPILIYLTNKISG